MSFHFSDFLLIQVPRKHQTISIQETIMSVDIPVANFQAAIRAKVKAQSIYDDAFRRHKQEDTKQAWSAKMAALGVLTAVCTEANAAEVIAHPPGVESIESA
jgi:hypothetical protein